MSVLDQVRALEQQVLQRLRELRPLVDEYRDLEQVAERLGLKRDDEQPTEAGATLQAEPSPRRKPTARRSAKRAARVLEAGRGGEGQTDGEEQAEARRHRQAEGHGGSHVKSQAEAARSQAKRRRTWTARTGCPAAGRRTARRHGGRTRR